MQEYAVTSVPHFPSLLITHHAPAPRTLLSRHLICTDVTLPAPPPHIHTPAKTQVPTSGLPYVYVGRGWVGDICPPGHLKKKPAWSPLSAPHPQHKDEPRRLTPSPGFSPIQVATHADHSFASCLQTYITFEGRARPAPLTIWPFGAPVLFLCCCHGKFCFAPT